MTCTENCMEKIIEMHDKMRYCYEFHVTIAPIYVGGIFNRQIRFTAIYL